MLISLRPGTNRWFRLPRWLCRRGAIQFGTTYRNNALDQFETTVGTAPILTIRSGAAPANCGTANSGTVLATLTLPSDWMSAASGGTKALLGTWSDTSADNSGTAQHFRIHDSSGTVCHMQGTVTATGGGGGDMTVDSTSFTAGQSFTVTGFTLTAPNS